MLKWAQSHGRETPIWQCFSFRGQVASGRVQAAATAVLSNNLGGTANLLEAALENGWTKCVFSSTAAVCGNPVTETISEDHLKAAINARGQTKLAMEQLLDSTCKAEEVSAVCLYYFNAAGASSDESIGEAREPETHLIPNAPKAASGTGQPQTIFGDDYPPPDGTCIRDYIHVEDLADVHLKTMDYLQQHRVCGVQSG